MSVRSRATARSLAVAAAAALVLTITGAFDTGDEPFHKRLIYWLAVMAAGSAWGQMCQLLLARWTDLDGRPWLHILALTGAVAVPMSLFVWAATGLFFHGELYPVSFLQLLVVPVVTVTAAVCALIVFLGRATPVQTHIFLDADTPVRFIERLPLRLRRARLIAVEAEDHYLRVHTDRGSDLILMRLSDALTELDGLEGAQTHRSWWVAKDAVRDARRGDGRATLTLDGGLTAPVSRRYARSLREAGWY
ncbi:MAG: LytTR family transcriptional regulator DNA-binding domain-containing protein [Pseudomonadota bacterium]|nr:LytTR family transcriptional regulator DNA-binding domain-containing protein [Pseudomonadota bacterium]